MSTHASKEFLDKIILQGLDEHLATTLGDRYVAEKVKEFEEELRATIQPRLDEITVETVERVRDMMRLGEELRINIFHRGSDD